MDDALTREEARQLELALAASLADQGTPPSVSPASGSPSSRSTVGRFQPPASSSNGTPPGTAPKASSSVGGPGGLAFIPGFGSILDSGSKPSAKSGSSSSTAGLKNAAQNPSLQNGDSGFSNGGVPRQRRQGVHGGPAGDPANGGIANTAGGPRSQDEQDRELALRLAAEENRKGPRNADEERDRLLALRLQQEEQARSVEASPRPSPLPPQASDEDIARKLQEQLELEDRLANEGTPPGAPATGEAPRGGFRLPLGGSLGSAPEIPAPLRSLGQRLSELGSPNGQNQVCARCKQPITSGRYTYTADKIWHEACVVCKWCGEVTSGRIKFFQGYPYHLDCYSKHVHPRCTVCRMPIPTNEHGAIFYRFDPFWLDTHCPEHETDGTARCCACNRMEPVDVPHVTLDDGRKLCLECCSSVVVDTADCQPLYREVLEFYETMGMRLRQKDIPLLLVERQALQEATEKEHSGGGASSGSHHRFNTRGLCVSEEEVIMSVVRKPAGRFAGAPGLSHETEQRVVRRHCEVTAILILFGLPRLLTGSILAHELMHAWIKIDGSFPALEPVVEEGICQVLAHMWLQSQLPAHSPNAQKPARTLSGVPEFQFRVSDGGAEKTEEEVAERLAEYFANDIAVNPTDVYGAGFRAGHAAVVKFGLESVLENMRMTGMFPE